MKGHGSIQIPKKNSKRLYRPLPENFTISIESFAIATESPHVRRKSPETWQATRKPNKTVEAQQATRKPLASCYTCHWINCHYYKLFTRSVCCLHSNIVLPTDVLTQLTHAVHPQQKNNFESTRQYNWVVISNRFVREQMGLQNMFSKWDDSIVSRNQIEEECLPFSPSSEKEISRKRL